MRPLGELEALVMQQLWDREGTSTVRDIQSALRADRELAYTTVMTVLDNLHRKEMVTRQRTGRAYAYAPARSRSEYTADLIAMATDDAEDRAGALLHFFGRLEPAELERLKSALNDQATPAEPDDEPRSRRFGGRSRRS